MLFFRCDVPVAEAPPLPPGMRMRLWTPARDGMAHRPWRWHNIAWWLMERFGLFARHDFTEITFWQGPRLVHRLILTPRWYRFPFMEAQDLQIGDVWTDPAHRGQGLARLGIGQALALAAETQSRVWYLTEAGNMASIAVAGRAGFALAGLGERSRPFLISAAGRYRRFDPQAAPPPRR